MKFLIKHWRKIGIFILIIICGISLFLYIVYRDHVNGRCKWNLEIIHNVRVKYHDDNGVWPNKLKSLGKKIGRINLNCWRGASQQSYKLDINGELFCLNDHYGWTYRITKKGEFKKIKND
ncbi:MAG: hypothetical protein MJH11_00220 [Lentisphaeria bacterium]|nr:hypothetical protein [Lentisphaeria bacterium]